MRQYTTLKLTKRETIANVNLQWSDPSQLNAVGLSELLQLINEIEDDETCKLIIFWGLDVQQTAIAAPPTFDACSKWEKFLRRLERFAGASIAAIDGYCTRFHVQLALACDYRVATARSLFQIPEVKEGYLPGMGVFRLAKYTGVGVARRLLFTGAQFSVEEAIALGIVDRACETTALEQTIEDVQQALMPIHPQVLQNTRRLLNESFATSYEDAIGHYLAVQDLCLSQLPERT
ncbi:enoyl-CoA hydratase/isomerase family protein [Roseofilum sp. BLCC_M154]|uniref:Enoyl-CoA hydratase/isomerase family protein n=1 Tax=Roseofilum acuticapitatum BLCC-M154 TaxID=3022444 RepID=A0ABT7AXY4_9CYAN|nr:enoyl-CoA hydratase/isomerase family protein [Roseofilum acuticapitatum]MDJ1171289.1 enoyl-CoA hydratase/isomerase family protein [Roseofilum acuticapitatum BLCC-M154]